MEEKSLKVLGDNIVYSIDYITGIKICCQILIRIFFCLISLSGYFVFIRELIFCQSKLFSRIFRIFDKEIKFDVEKIKIRSLFWW